MLDPYLKQQLLETPLRDSWEALVTAKRLLAAKRYSSNTTTTAIPAVTASTATSTTSTSTVAEATTTNILATTYHRGQPVCEEEPGIEEKEAMDKNYHCL